MLILQLNDTILFFRKLLDQSEKILNGTTPFTVLYECLNSVWHYSKYACALVYLVVIIFFVEYKTNKTHDDLSISNFASCDLWL
jgi:hypothetical protein